MLFESSLHTTCYDWHMINKPVLYWHQCFGFLHDHPKHVYIGRKKRAYDEARPAYMLECYRDLQRYSMHLHCKVQHQATCLAPSQHQEYPVSIFLLRGCQCLQANVNNRLVPGNASLLAGVTQPTQMQSACLGRHGKLVKMGSPATTRECRSFWQDSRSKKRRLLSRLLSRFALRMPG